MCSKSWKVKLSKQSESDLKYWYKTDKKIYKKVLKILEILETNPTNLDTILIASLNGSRGILQGCMSRRINLVYIRYLEKKKLLKFFK